MEMESAVKVVAARMTSLRQQKIAQSRYLCYNVKPQSLEEKTKSISYDIGVGIMFSVPWTTFVSSVPTKLLA